MKLKEKEEIRKGYWKISWYPRGDLKISKFFLFAKKKYIRATYSRIWKYSRLARKLEYKDARYRYLIYAKSLKIFNIFRGNISQKIYSEEYWKTMKQATIIYFGKKIPKYRRNSTKNFPTSEEKLRNIPCRTLSKKTWKTTRNIQYSWKKKNPKHV